MRARNTKGFGILRWPKTIASVHVNDLVKPRKYDFSSVAMSGARTLITSGELLPRSDSLGIYQHLNDDYAKYL